MNITKGFMNSRIFAFFKPYNVVLIILRLKLTIPSLSKIVF